MTVAMSSPTSKPTMLEKSSVLTRRSASQLSTGDISVGHTQRCFSPADAEPQLWLITDDYAKSFLILGRHPNEFDASRPPGHPSHYPQIDSHGPELVEIDEQLHVLSPLKRHGRL